MSRHRVAVLLAQQVLPLDFAIPVHVFGREAAQHYEVVTAAADGTAVTLAGGASVNADGDLDALAWAQTVVVPGYLDADTTALDSVTVGSLRAAAVRGTRMVSICSGAFALAQAGILDGRTATTHWSLCRALARQHSRVRVDPAPLFVDSGAVLTSGGVTAGVDLALHILRADLGTAVANHVARRILMTPRREGEQSQFSEGPPPAGGDDELGLAQQWMLASLDQPVTVAQMAARAHLSARHFHRRFLRRTGLTPLAWLHQHRITRTKELLEGTDLSVEEIAIRVGLGSPANLRVHFRRATSVSPMHYRQSFGHAALSR